MISKPPLKTIWMALLCAVTVLAGCASLDTPSSTEGLSKASPDPLSAWSKTPVKESILQYLADVTEPGGSSYVPPEDRIATFDFDGTLGCEKPDYMEVMVAMRRLCELSQRDASQLDPTLLQAACDNDYETINAQVDEALLQAFLGESQTFYTDYVRDFIDSQPHPRFERPYAELYYLPMLQLVELLQSKDFAVYVVSGSQQGFTRSYGSHVLGLAPPHLVGHAVHLDFSLSDMGASLVRQDTFLDPTPGGDGKAEIIRQRIGKAPILAFDNSMGDLEMLQYATQGPRRGLGLILVHDDPDEYVYQDAELLQNAENSGWQVVSMKDDFEVIFP